ncbi:fasciclin domain-containing protein [Fibrisoma limi]|nr:fasciclin domain-containing protein [Fibrisoma limi]
MHKAFSHFFCRISALFFVLVTAVSCQTDEDASPKTIPDVVQEDPQFSILRAAITYAGVSDNLKGGNLTLFAPDNTAFQASGFLDEAAVTSVPKEQLRSILLYHVLSAGVNSTEIPAGQSQVETASRGVLYVNNSSNGTIFVNGARVTRADVQTANGIIHVIDKVLTPSAGTTLQAIETNPNLTFLTAAIRRIESVNPTITATLSSTSASSQPVTVLAPDDNAFRASRTYNTLASIQAANPQALASVLLYHVLPGATMSYQFQPGSVNTLLTNSRVVVNVSGSLITVKGNGNTIPATIRRADQVTNNGILHVIDQVLIP